MCQGEADDLVRSVVRRTKHRRPLQHDVCDRPRFGRDARRVRGIGVSTVSGAGSAGSSARPKTAKSNRAARTADGGGSDVVVTSENICAGEGGA